MSSPQATRVCVQTAEGRGAVAVVLIEGPAAVAAVDACFRAANGKPLSNQPQNAIRFGRWGGDAGEEVVVVRTCDHPQPAVEVHCHGGTAAVRAVVRDLVAEGCVEQPWTAAAPPKATRATADAQVALRHALTERTMGVLLDQADGALEGRLRRLVVELQAGQGGHTLSELLSWSEFSQHLTRPWRVVLAGAPNVGKSSLINALLGYARAIVFDQPGTTRDVLSADTAVEGWPISLSDTAGLRAADDPTEAAGVELATQMLRRADLIVEVRDARQPDAPSVLPSGQPSGEHGGPLTSRRLVVWNKCDLAGNSPSDGLATCATTGQGVDQLLTAVAGALVPRVPPPGQPMPVTAAQCELLARAEQAVRRGEHAAAEQAVQSLLAAD